VNRSIRVIYAIVAVSLLTFVAGVVLIVMAVRPFRREATFAGARPVASVKQLMQGIVSPASKAIYNAVSTTVTEKGTEEVRPRSDREWEVVGSNAMALIEAASLLTTEGRAKDSDWFRLSDMMSRAALQSYNAAKRKDVDALLASGEVLNNSCDSCHRNYDVPVD